MAEIRDIGEKLVLNFSLLLEYWPDDKCQEYVRKNFLKRHVNNLMLADDLRSIRKQKERSETVSEYIRRLELLNSCNIGTDIFVNKLSPVNQNNSGMDVVDTFTPGQVSGERAINFRKRPLTIDPNSVADLVVPPKILSLQSIVPKIGKKKVAFEGSPNLPDISQRIKFAAKNRVVCFPATQRNQDLNRAACGDVAWQPQPHSVPSKVSESVGKWRTSTRNRAGELCNPCGIVGKRLDGTENELWDRQSNLGCTTSDISGKVDAMSEKNRGMMQEGHLDCDTLELGKDVLRTPKCRLRPKSSGKNLFDECFWMESTSSSQVFDSFSFSNKLNLAKEVDSAVFSLSKMETESRSVHSCICESSLCLLNSCLQNSFTLTDEITSPIGN